MTFYQSASSGVTLRVLIIPAAVLVLQLSGCTSRSTPTPAPPGGTYLSQSAGAHFDQSVELADGTGTIAQFNLLKAHRPAHTPSHIYIGAGTQGYVVSANGGETWQVVKTSMAAVADVVLLENGVLVASGIDESGQGLVVRSSDSGRSWETTLTIPSAVDDEGFQLIRGPDVPSSIVMTLAIDPFNPNRIYAGSNLGTIFVGEQSAKTWRTMYTLSGGPFPSSAQRRLGVLDIIPSPHTVGELLVITSRNELVRVTSDKEQTEIKIAQDLPATGPFVNRDQKKVFDVTYVAGFPEALFAGVEDGAVISRDRGQTWTQLNVPLEQATEFNTAAVAVSPSNASRLVVGINHVVYRSEDGGESWNTFSLGLTQHGITALLIDPTNVSRVLAVTSPLSN